MKRDARCVNAARRGVTTRAYRVQEFFGLLVKLQVGNENIAARLEKKLDEGQADAYR